MSFHLVFLYAINKTMAQTAERITQSKIIRLSGILRYPVADCIISATYVVGER
jgi:hypothetical protein